MLNENPLVVISRPVILLSNETLKKGEPKYTITFTIQAFSKDQVSKNTRVARQVVLDELEGLIYDVFADHYGMLNTSNLDAPNIDSTIDRIITIYTGVIIENNNETYTIYRK